VIERYRARVPIRTYEDIEPFIARIARGERSVLTIDPVRRLVPSSGSTSGTKLLPFTGELQREFSRAVDAWIVDLYRAHPALTRGPSYWSISPARSFAADRAHPIAPLAAQAGIPIGFEDDSRYLGGTRALLARAIQAVPPSVRDLTDVARFRYVTLRHLLQAHDLRLISVWHPSFLTLLLDQLAVDWDRLLRDLVAGPSRRRAAALARLRPDEIGRIWPALEIVSCWADGPAHLAAQELAARLRSSSDPGRAIAIQPKGLLATEAVVTIPFADRHPLAIRSHFFEFLNQRGEAVLAHQLQSGTDYAVVVTTAGGLYRYALGDRVTVNGWVDATASLTFVGRHDRVSDQCGEKLTDGFVASAVANALTHFTVPRFAMLAPRRTPDGLRYTLFVEMDGAPSPALAPALETELRRNPHYAWCVDLGQLQPAEVVRTAAHANERYIDACVRKGMTLGDVKPASLRAELDWHDVLAG
jgi:GH3 auxin-responsive promoter